MLPKLQLSGMTQQLAEHCLLREVTDNQAILELDTSGETLRTDSTEQTLQQAINEHLQRKVALRFEVLAEGAETPQKRKIRLDIALQQEAEASISADPFVQQLQQDWGGVVLPGSVRPNRDV